MVMDQRKEEYYQVLELSPDATRLEIEQAYKRLQKLFSPTSLATYSMMPPDERDAILIRIEEAYKVLTGKDEEYRFEVRVLPDTEEDSSTVLPPSMDEQSAHGERQVTGDVSAGEESLNSADDSDTSYAVQYNGAYLRRMREVRSIPLEKVESATKISQASLQFIEDETFDQLPARAYVRGFVILYARFLGLNTEEVVKDYMKKYDERIAPDNERKGRRPKRWGRWRST